MSSGRRAFTLIELLLVISIIAGLLATLLPSLADARSSTTETVCASRLRQIGGGLGMYLGDHGDVYPATDDPVSEDPFYWLWMGRGFRRYVGPYLVADISTQNPNVLFCPADPAPPEKYERTSFAYSMAFYHSPEQINAMSSPVDCYANPQPVHPQSTSHVLQPSRKILAGEWNSNHQPLENDGGWWDPRGRRVFLLADGHASTHAAEQINPANDGLPDPNLTIFGIRGSDVP